MVLTDTYQYSVCKSVPGTCPPLQLCSALQLSILETEKRTRAEERPDWSRRTGSAVAHFYLVSRLHTHGALQLLVRLLAVTTDALTVPVGLSKMPIPPLSRVS